MSIAVFILILSLFGFLGMVVLGFALSSGMVDGLMRDFVVLNLVGAAHLLILALVGGMWFIG